MVYKRILYNSDDHILYPGSRQREGYRAETFEDISKYDCYIRNGDNYDFHYHIHVIAKKITTELAEEGIFPDEECFDKSLVTRLKRGVEHASIHDATLAKACPNTLCLSTMGNHDPLKRYGKAMDKIKAKHSNFGWSEDYIRIGTNGNVEHGDMILRGQNGPQREQMQIKAELGKVLKANFLNVEFEMTLKNWRGKMLIERVVHNAVQGSWFNFWNSRQLLVPRLHSKMQENPDMYEGIEHMFIGHVHTKPFHNIEHEGVLFHQAGAGIYNRNCQPLEVTVELPRGEKELKFEGKNLAAGGRIVEVQKALIRGLSFPEKHSRVSTIATSAQSR